MRSQVTPIAVYHSSDGGKWLIGPLESRGYLVYGPWDEEPIARFKDLEDAQKYVLRFISSWESWEEKK